MESIVNVYGRMMRKLGYHIEWYPFLLVKDLKRELDKTMSPVIIEDVLSMIGFPRNWLDT